MHLATSAQPTMPFLLPTQMNWCLREEYFVHELLLGHARIYYWPEAFH